jgi:hypothetical protein
MRASSDLLRTLLLPEVSNDADVEDIPHITHALYLLAQDGCDLLQGRPAAHAELESAGLTLSLRIALTAYLRAIEKNVIKRRTNPMSKFFMN